MRHNKYIYTLVLIVLAISIVTIYNFMWIMGENPLDQSIIEYPSYFIKDQGMAYIIDQSNTRILGVDNGEVKLVLKGGSRNDDRFYFVHEVISKNERIYLLSYTWDKTGSYIESESVKAFSQDGKYESTLFELEYEKDSVRVPLLCGLSLDEGRVRFFKINDNDVVLYEEANDFTINEVQRYLFRNARLLVQDIDRENSMNIIVATRDGYLKRIDTNDKVSTLFDGSKTNIAPQEVLPWSVEVSKDGRIYFSNIGDGTIRRLNENGDTKIIWANDNSVMDSSSETYYKISMSNDGYVGASSANGGLAIKDDGEEILERSTLSKFWFGAKIQVKIIVGWIAVLFVVILIAYLIYKLYRLYHRTGTSALFGRVFFIIIAILMTSILVGQMLVDNFYGMYSKEIKRNLMLSAQNFSREIDPESIENIKSPKDYLKSDYNKLYERINSKINYNKDSWNENMYVALYKVIEGRVYGLIYNDGSITPFYPFDAFIDDPSYSYFRNAYEGNIVSDTEIDSDGQWIFSMAPVFDDNGNIVAILEVGSNLFIFNEMTETMVKKIVVDVITLVIIIIMISVEIEFFKQNIKGRKWTRKKTKKSFSAEDMSLIRLLSFLAFIMIYMAMAFIPLIAKMLYMPQVGITESFVIGLPITAEVLASGITMIFAGYYTQKKGWRSAINIGVMVLICASILTALSWNIQIFTGMRFISGIGTGFVFMALRAYVNQGKTASERNAGFAQLTAGAVAGMNVGVALGANISEKIGMLNVFFIMAGVGVFVFAFVKLFMPEFERMDVKRNEEETGLTKCLNMYRDYRVLVFFLMILIPAYIAGMYLEYLFPIYAENLGLSNSFIGLAFILYGCMIVYFGPPISAFLETKYSVKAAVAMASALTALAMGVFAFTGDLVGAILAVIILGLSDSVGENAYNNYFLEIESVKNMGESTASGHFEFVSYIGKMVGPACFAALMMYGPTIGMSLLALILLIALFIFVLTGRKSKV